MVRSSVQTEQQGIRSVQTGSQKQSSVYLAYGPALGDKHSKGQSQRKFENLWFGQSMCLHGGSGSEFFPTVIWQRHSGDGVTRVISIQGPCTVPNPCMVRGISVDGTPVLLVGQGTSVLSVISPRFVSVG